MTWLENYVCIKYVSANTRKIFGILFWAFRADCNGSVSSEYALLMMREINCAWSYLTQWLWQVSFSGPVFTEVTLTSHSWNGKRSKAETLTLCGLPYFLFPGVHTEWTIWGYNRSHFGWLLTPFTLHAL